MEISEKIVPGSLFNNSFSSVLTDIKADETFVCSPFLNVASAVVSSNSELRSSLNAASKSKSFLIYEKYAKKLVFLTQAEYGFLSDIVEQGAVKGSHLIENLIPARPLYNNQLVLPLAEAVARHQYTKLEIEINQHCNFRCAFCPVHSAPKRPAFITDELVKKSLMRAAEYGIEEIAFHHFSEPTLNKKLVSYLEWASDYDFKILLHTNGSLITPKLIAALKSLKKKHVCVNLPTINKRDYEKITGSHLFDKVMTNLDELANQDIIVELSINAPKDSQNETVARINEKFSARFGNQSAWYTNDRCGLVEDDTYVEKIVSNSAQIGCYLASNQIHVNYKGDVFLCTQDYNQEIVLGNIESQSLREIADGAKALEARRKIYRIDSIEGSICSKCAYHGRTLVHSKFNWDECPDVTIV